MTTTVAHRSAATLSASTIVDRIVAAARTALAGMKARHDYRKMLQLDEAHLADMGVTRAVVRQALAAA